MSALDDFDKAEGLYKVSADDSAAKINVVFVHGLGGSGRRTWDSGPDGEMRFWPETLAEDHPGCCVWTLNYITKVYEWNPLSHSRIDLLDRAVWFVETLIHHGITGRPIVFVAHSLGGLIVKQALQFSYGLGPAEWRNVWDQTRAVVFLATPHAGAQLADVAIHAAEAIGQLGFVSRLFLHPSPALRDLLKNSPTLRYLSDWYRDHGPEAGIRTLAFSEGCAYKGVLVVDPGSANPQVPHCVVVPLPGDDHVSIAKPARKDALVYRKLSGLLDELEAGTAQGASRPTANGAEKDPVDQLAGDWWGRVTTGAHESVLSLSRIERHRASGSAVVTGISFDLEGELVAEWNSRYSSIRRSQNSNGIELEYLFEGTRLKVTPNAKVEGHSAFNFPESSDPLEEVRYGKGRFFSVYLADEIVNSRWQELRRAAQPADVRIAREGSTAQRKELVLRTLRALWDWTPAG